jgi:heme/copper-type cytochrome/quinol oxidase subunit 2
MSSINRIFFACAALIVLLIAVLLFKPVDESNPPATTSPAPPAEAPDQSTAADATSEPKATATPRPKPLTVEVRGLQPVNGVKELDVREGERVRFNVTSDQPEEVHVHGYDVTGEVGPAKPATFSFPATITGIFEVELEHAGVEILKLTVRP